MNDQQNKMKEMQQIARLKQSRAADLFEQRLNAEFYPSDKLSDLWRECTHKALLKSAPAMHKIPLSDFGSVVSISPHKKITLFQLGVLSNSLEFVSPDQLGISPDDYTRLITESVVHIKHFNARMKTIRDECDIQAEKEISMKMAVESGEKNKQAVIKPIMGQA